MLLNESDLCQRIHKESLLEKIRSDEENTFQLIRWSLSTEQPLGWRAAWLLRQLLRKNDERLLPYLDKVISSYPAFNESQKREWLKTIINQDLNDHQEGLLYDLCVNDWLKINNHPALRASALVLVFKVIQKYPELMQEVHHLITDDYLSALSPGIRKGIVKEWTALQKR